MSEAYLPFVVHVRDLAQRFELVEIAGLAERSPRTAR